MSPKNIIVTGVTGFIGYHLALQLAKVYSNVIGIDNNLRGGADSAKEKLQEAKVHYIDCDLSNYSELVERCSKYIIDCEYIYHLAAYNGTQNFYKYPYKVIKNSSLPTMNIVEFVIKNELNCKILYTGSSESYAESVNRGIEKIPTNESALVSLGSLNNPRWSYSCGKTFGEYLLSSANIQYGLQSVIARVHNIYGPRMGKNHFFPDFINRLLEGDFSVYGAKQTRSFCHISDCCNALIYLMESDIDFGIYNVGSNNEINIYDCAELIMEIMNVEGELKILEPPIGSVNRRCPDISKINRLLGDNWEKKELKSGLIELVKWYSQKNLELEKNFQ